MSEILKNIPFLQCNQSNYQSGRNYSIRYIVIHYTSNNGDTAEHNCLYFHNYSGLKASAHIFVDENGYYQSVKLSDTAWHCGGPLESEHHPYKNICTNSNSIGIELCSRKANGKYYFEENTVTNAVALVKELMSKYAIDNEHVIRHYDVTGKNCPAPFVETEEDWIKFKNKLNESEDKLMSKEYEELKAENDRQNDIINQMGIELEELRNTAKTEIYDYIDDNMPEWARPTIAKLVNKRFLKGDEEGKLGLTEDLMRLLVINDRAGIYGE